jgi:DNA-binding NtrC family response regulator
MSENNARIIIVDDDQLLTSFLGLLVKLEGFKPLEFDCGEAALRTLCSESAAVMLLDMELPGMNGLEVLRQAKRYDPTIQVIIMTGHYDTYGAAKAIKTGAYDYLIKPFNGKEMIRIVHQALVERQQICQVRDTFQPDLPLKQAVSEPSLS